MAESSALRWLEQASGALLVTLVLVDVFLTVLYARAGAGLFGNRLSHLIWQAFRWASVPLGKKQGTALSFCGPFIVVAVILTWLVLLMVGAALVIHPNLGSVVRTGSGQTPTDFITALYAGGGSVAIIGASDFIPHTAIFRLLFLFKSIVGTCLVSLTLSYVLQVYNGLQRRNALGLQFHLMGAESGDAAELLAGLGPRGEFSGGYNNLSELAAMLTQVKESHHFFPVLAYFRFNEPYYSVSRLTLQSFDTVSLIKSALNDEKHAWLKESAAVTQLWRAAMLLVTTVGEVFLPGETPEPEHMPDAPTKERWRRRYFAALRRLRQAGIETAEDEEAGAAIYIALRTRWDHRIQKLVPLMAYNMAEIDPAGSDPQSSDALPAFGARRNSV